MATRDTNKQDLHDRVIYYAEQRLDKSNHEVYINPGLDKNAGVGNLYPDIIITRRATTTIEFIIEVETAESINIREAKQQWTRYSKEINATFYLLVPYSNRAQTINLCKLIGISARIGTYQTDAIGHVTSVTYE